MKFFYKNFFRFVVLIAICAGFMSSTYAQDSSRLRISLLTCTPGEELYSIFGHSAVRVTDSNSVTDHVYNFGTFNFDDEGFYLKFLRGKLNYMISLDQFEDFKNDYIAQNRGITEQELIFSGEEKINIRNALNENLKEENKYYLYNFFLDNCTTRLRDIIVKNHRPLPALPYAMPAGSTFRDGLHKYQDLSDRPWTKIGMDLLLGTPADDVMTPAQQSYLPDNLMFSLAGVKNTPIISTTKNLYSITTEKNGKVIFTPLFFFTALLIVFILLSLSQNVLIKKILTGLDGFVFFTVGLFGIVFAVMWVGTDHYMMKNNYNLLWGWPMHIVYAFFINKNTKRVRTYSLLTAVFLVLLLCAWFFLAQEMHNALIPLVMLMIYRSGVRFLSPQRKESREVSQSDDRII